MIAFATRDGVHVNEELRRSSGVVVYEVGAGVHRLARVATFAPGAGRTEDRMLALAGCALVYVSAAGPSIAARLASRGIRVATAPVGTPIERLLQELRALLPSAEHEGARAG